MAMGMRLKGQAGNIQISDDAPTYMIVERGAINPNTKVLDVGDPAGVYLFCQVYYFANVVATPEPPLVFIRIDNMIGITNFQFIGTPGAWRGFILGTSIGINVQLTATGEYFVAASVVPKSNDRIGIRVRNKTTNEIIFDSGYPIVKFLSYISTVVQDNSQMNKWNQAGNGPFQWYLHSASMPIGSFLLMNAFQGYIAEGASVEGFRSMITMAFDPILEPGKIRLTVLSNNQNNTYAYDASPYYWMFVFAMPGA